MSSHCVALGQVLRLSESQFPPWKMGILEYWLKGLLWGLKELMHGELCPARGHCSISDGYYETNVPHLRSWWHPQVVLFSLGLRELPNKVTYETGSSQSQVQKYPLSSFLQYPSFVSEKHSRSHFHHYQELHHWSVTHRPQGGAPVSSLPVKNIAGGWCHTAPGPWASARRSCQLNWEGAFGSLIFWSTARCGTCLFPVTNRWLTEKTLLWGWKAKPRPLSQVHREEFNESGISSWGGQGSCYDTDGLQEPGAIRAQLSQP